MTTNLYEIPVKQIDGAPAKLAAHKGKVLLIVNVASKCGLTPQYEGLEQLYESKRAQGLEVLGFPANNFGGQEPGADSEIATFCTEKFDVHFPMYSKISVLGADQHPLYRALTGAKPESTGDGPFRERLKGYGVKPGDKADVLWNFEKFLVSRKGEVVGRFAPNIAPDDPLLTTAIDTELAKPV